METKVTKDGFVWLVVPDNYAMEMWKANLATLYVLHNDDSETMVETDLQMADAIHDGERIGIEVGFIKGLLPACPQCGSRLVPSRNPECNYMQWFITDSILSVSYGDSIGNDHYFTEPKGIMFFWDEYWDNATIISGRYHKATVDELIEHFKTKENNESKVF